MPGQGGGMDMGWASRTQRGLLGLQFDSCVWMPNLPASMQLPPPTSKGQTRPEGFLATLPPVNATCDIIVALWLLSKEPGDQVSMGAGGRAGPALGCARGCCFPSLDQTQHCHQLMDLGPFTSLSFPRGTHEHWAYCKEGQIIK